MRTYFLCCVGAACSVVGFSQNPQFHRHNAVVDFGAATPVGSATSYLSTAPLVSFGYGYRLNRYFQADAGFQIAFGAARNQNAEQTNFGAVQGGDHEYMIPLGGRFIIPVPLKRMEVAAGGGAAYLHYAETAPSNPDFPLSCYSCTSRGGWGGYGLANVRYFLDSNHTFHVGATYQFVTASTNGQPVGNVPGLKTTDHWSNMTVGIGLSF